MKSFRKLLTFKKKSDDETSGRPRSSSDRGGLSFHDNPMGSRGGEGSLDKRSLSRQASAERLRQRPAPVPEALFIEPPSIEVARLVKKAPPDSLGGRVWTASVNWSADGTAGPPQKKKSRLFRSSSSSTPSPPRPSSSRNTSKESVLGFRFAMNRPKKNAPPSAAASGADASKDGNGAVSTPAATTTATTAAATTATTAAAAAASASESGRLPQTSDLPPPVPSPPRVVRASGHRGGRGSRGRLSSHGSGSSVDDDDDDDSDDELSDEDELDVGDPNVLPPAEDMEPDGPPQMATYDGGEEGEGWEEYDENSDTLEAEEDFQRQRAGSRSRTKSVYKSDSEDDEEDPDAPEPYLVDGAGEGGEGSGNGNRGRTNSGSSAGRGGGGRSSTGRPGYGTGHGVVSANMQRIDMMKAAGYGNRPERSSLDRVTPGEKAALEAGLETRAGELSPSRGQQRSPVLAFGSPARDRAGSFGPGLGDGHDGASKDVDDNFDEEDDEEGQNARRSPFGFFRRPAGRQSFCAKNRGKKSRRGSRHAASAMAAELVQALAPGPSVVASLQRARIVVVGDEGVGVSALVRRFTLQPPTTDVDLVTGYGAWDPDEFVDTAAQTKTEARKQKDKFARKEARRLAKEQQQQQQTAVAMAAEAADATTTTTSTMTGKSTGNGSPRAMSNAASNGLRSSRGRSLSTDVGPSISIRRSAESVRSLSPMPSSAYADDVMAKERAVAAERAAKSGPWHAIRPVTLHGSNNAVYPYQVQVYDLGRVLHPRFKPADSSTNEKAAPEYTGKNSEPKEAKSDLNSSSSLAANETGTVVASETTNRLVEDVVDAPKDIADEHRGNDSTDATGKVVVASGLASTLLRPSLVDLESMNVPEVAVSAEHDDDNDEDPLPESSLLGGKKFKSDARATIGDDDDGDDDKLLPFPPSTPRGSMSPSKVRVRLPTGGTGSSDSDDPIMAHGRLSSRIGSGAHRLLEDPPESVLQRASPMHRGSPPSSPPYFPVRTPSNEFPDLHRPSGEGLLRKPTDDLTPVPETRCSGDASSSTSEGKLSEASTEDGPIKSKKSTPEPLTKESEGAGVKLNHEKEEKVESDTDDDDDDHEVDDEEAQGYDDPAMSVTRRAVCDAYLRSATGIVLVYDIGDADTLEGLDQWLTRLEAAGVDFQRVPVAIFCNKIDLAAPASLRPSPEFSLARNGDPANEALRRSGANGVDHSSGSGSESSVPRTRSQTPVESATSESDNESGGDLQAMRALHRGTTSSSISPPRGSESYWFGGSNKAGTRIKGAADDAASFGGSSHDKPPGERGVEVKGCGGKLRSRSSSIGLRDSNGGLRDSNGASGKGRDSFRTSLGHRLSSWNPKLFTRSSFGSRDDISGGARSSEPPQPKVSRKSILARQQEEALAKAVLESRDARAKLYKSIEDFPQVRVARDVAEQRGLGSDIRGLGGLNNSNHGGTFDSGAVGAGGGGGNNSSSSSTFTVDLVSSATGEGVHAAFNRLMVAVQKRQHAQRPHRFALSGGAVTVTDHGPSHGDDHHGAMRRGSASSRSARRASRRNKALTLSGGRTSRANSGGASSSPSLSSSASSPGGKPRPLPKLSLWGSHSKERNGDSPREEAPHEGGL